MGKCFWVVSGRTVRVDGVIQMLYMFTTELRQTPLNAALVELVFYCPVSLYLVIVAV